MNINEMLNALEVLKTIDPTTLQLLLSLGGNSTTALSTPANNPVAPTASQSFRVSEEDFPEEPSAKPVKAEFGCWRAISRKTGEPYTWCGWADPNTGKPVFPGHQLYYVNDFYLQRDYGAYHPGKTTAYKFRSGFSMKAMCNFPVRSAVDPKDAKAFQEYMKAKQEKRRQVNLTDEMWSNWIK